MHPSLQGVVLGSSSIPSLFLADPVQAVELPEIIEEHLESGYATCIAFNRRGTLLAGASPCRWRCVQEFPRSEFECLAHAAGTAVGSIVLWDFDTKGVVKSFEGGHE